MQKCTLSDVLRSVAVVAHRPQRRRRLYAGTAPGESFRGRLHHFGGRDSAGWQHRSLHHGAVDFEDLGSLLWTPVGAISLLRSGVLGLFCFVTHHITSWRSQPGKTPAPSGTSWVWPVSGSIRQSSGKFLQKARRSYTAGTRVQGRFQSGRTPRPQVRSLRYWVRPCRRPIYIRWSTCTSPRSAGASSSLPTWPSRRSSRRCGTFHTLFQEKE